MNFFLAVAGVLGITAALSVVNERLFHLQQTIGLMLLALLGSVVLMGLSAAGIPGLLAGEQELVTRLSLDQTLLNGVLCFLLFAGSIHVRLDCLGEERWIVLTLALGATLGGALLVGAAMAALSPLLGIGLGLAWALVFGALIAPTDPVATVAILDRALPPHLAAVIEGESLFNDGVAVVLFTIFLALAVGAREATLLEGATLFLRETFGGVLLGLVAAWVLHRGLVGSRDESTQLLLSLAVTAVAYGLAEELLVSGPLAMVVTGLLVGNRSLPELNRKSRGPFVTFWAEVERILNAMLFVLLGLHVALVPPSDLLLAGLAAVPLCLLLRWLSVIACLALLRVAGDRRVRPVALGNFLSWVGLRGGLALAMALSVPDVAEKPVILCMTYMVVAFSVIVQGLTIERVFPADRLDAVLPAPPSRDRGH